MKTKSTGLKKKSMHKLYLFLKSLIDVSESFYLKLTYFKNNYKKSFISIFDERDYSTQSASAELNIENIYIQRFLDWAASIFGSTEESFKSLKNKTLKNIHALREDILDFKPNTITILNMVSFIGLCLLFLIYYSFT